MLKCGRSLISNKHLVRAFVKVYNTECRRLLSSSRIRELFIDFFVKKSHLHVPSSSVLPIGESSLLFTNAGMNQFKSLLLGTISSHDPLAGLQRATNSQKCIRVGGKHNDLEDVGKDSYHHTFFEMLGNWSFGNYFKKEACEMAWELLTDTYGLPVDRLYVTYFGGNEDLGIEPDNECREIWLRIGIPAERILPFGMKDNFWDMGSTGPCGPCTEIHYSHVGGNASHLVNAGVPDVIELWNIVFILYNRKLNGMLEKLSKCHVDTGMGLERLTAVLQGSTSNYDTDLFMPLFDAIQKETSCRLYRGCFGANDDDRVDTAYRILADHARMCTVSIADGLLPNEVGAGHCLRKVLRRSVITAKLTLNSKPGLLTKLAPRVVSILGTAFPELSQNMSKIIDVIWDEEERFLQQFDKGLQLFNTLEKRMSNNIFTGDNMWMLYTSHSMPEDVILELIETKGMLPGYEEFKALQTDDKENTRKAYLLHKTEQQNKTIGFDEACAQKLLEMNVPITNDSAKYDFSFALDGIRIPSISSKILAIWDGAKFVSEISKSVNAALVTMETNFYAEAGGQVSDTGKIMTKDGGQFLVENVSQVMGYIIHHGFLSTGSLKIKEYATLTVDQHNREGCTRNHTAAHLLHAGLRKILGPSVEQKSSYVCPDHLRFDFPSKVPLSIKQLQELEMFLKDSIERKVPVRRLVTDFDTVKRLPNLITITGETYPPMVSIIAIGPYENHEDLPLDTISLEPCCGTHVPNTVEIQDFVIYSQKPQAQTIKSIHALTGPLAINARKMATAIEERIPRISEEITEMETLVKQGGFVNTELLNSELGKSRSLVAEGRLPLLCRSYLDQQIENLRRRLRKLMKLMVKNEVNKLIQASSDTKYFVHMFKTSGDEDIIFTEAVKCLPKVPFMIFVCSKEFISCRCFVPKELVSKTFNAEEWSKSVMMMVNPGSCKPLRNNPCVNFTFKIAKVENTDAILQTAHDFVS